MRPYCNCLFLVFLLMCILLLSVLSGNFKTFTYFNIQFLSTAASKVQDTAGFNLKRNLTVVPKFVNEIVFPEDRRLLCTIPKASCTLLRSFALVKLLNISIPKVSGFNYDDLRILHRTARDKLPQITSFSNEQLQYMLNSPEWKYAAVIRHPLPRLLSAYLDRIVTNKETFRLPLKPGRNYTLEQFISTLEDAANSDSRKMDDFDEHWQPQSSFCLFRQLPREAFDHIVDSDNDIAMSTMFQDMFGSFGSSWLQSAGRKNSSEKAHHITSAYKKLRMYFDENLATRVQALYKEDYERFGFGHWPS